MIGPYTQVSWAAIWKITFATGRTGSFRTRRRTEIFYFQKYCLIESNDRQSDHSHSSRQRPRRSVWRAKIKIAAMKLAISENREPNSPQSCENSGQMIHSEYDSHFSDGLFGTEQLLRTSFWRRFQKNDTVEVASERKVFFWR